MRTRFPARRTLPSRIAPAPSVLPISPRLSSRLLKAITDVREITFSERTFDRFAITSSVMPSVKNSFSGSALKLRNGRTATVGAPPAPNPASTLCAPLTSCWSVKTRSRADWNRRSAFFSRQWRTTSATAPGIAPPISGGSAPRTATIVSATEPFRKAFLSVSIS